jgi:hypothetical protein
MENIVWCRIRVGRVWVRVRAAGSGGGTGSSEAGNLWARLAATRPQECIHLVLVVRPVTDGNGRKEKKRMMTGRELRQAWTGENKWYYRTV